MATTEQRTAAKAPRPQVAAAAARASIAMRERDGDEVPPWLRDVAVCKAISKAAIQL